MSFHNLAEGNLTYCRGNCYKLGTVYFTPRRARVFLEGSNLNDHLLISHLEHTRKVG